MDDGSSLHPGNPPNGPLGVLEQRVHRLEDAVAALQDTRQLEERLVERVTDRVSRTRLAGRDAPGLVIEARRHLLPATIGLIQSATDAPDAGALPEAQPARAPWLIFDVYAEARAMFRMFVDPRYRMGRWTWLATAGLFVAILTSWIWLPGTFLLPGWFSTILVKAVDLVLAFFLFKVLSREAHRYRAMFPDLSAKP